MSFHQTLTRNSAQFSIVWHKSFSECRSYAYAQVTDATELLRNVLLAETAAAQNASAAAAEDVDGDDDDDEEVKKKPQHFVGVLLGHDPAIVPTLLG